MRGSGGVIRPRGARGSVVQLPEVLCGPVLYVLRKCHAASPCFICPPEVLYSPGGFARPPEVLCGPRELRIISCVC